MAITLDTYGTDYQAGSSTTQTYSYTTGVGTTMLVVCLNNEGNQAYSSVTFNGVSMTEEIDVSLSSPANYRWAIYTLANPSIGTYNIVATMAGATAFRTMVVESLKGTKTTSYVDHVESGQSASTRILTTFTTTVQTTSWSVGLGSVAGGATCTGYGGTTRTSFSGNNQGFALVDGNGDDSAWANAGARYYKTTSPDGAMGGVTIAIKADATSTGGFFNFM